MQACTLGFAAVLGLALGQAAWAQNLRIGFVNVDYLLQNAPQTQAVNQKLGEEFGPRDAELQADAQAWQTKREEYERDAPVMPESQRVSRAGELEREQRDLERRQAALQEDLQIRQRELLGELQANVGRRVQAFAVAQGYDLIVTNVVYASETVDITEEVLAAISAGATTNAEPAAESTTSE